MLLEGPASILSEVESLLPRPPWQRTGVLARRTWRITELNGAWHITVDGDPFGTWSEQAEAARRVRGDMELWAAEHADGLAVVHACVVAVDGAALVVAGPSMAGKTTLALELVRAGAEYWSDEFAVLDAGGRVYPYLRRPSVRWALTAVDHLPLEGLRRPARMHPIPVRLIARVDFRPGCTPLDVTEVTPAEAALLLLANAVAARSQPGLVTEAAVAAAAGARGLNGERGEAVEAAAALLALLPKATDPAGSGRR